MALTLTRARLVVGLFVVGLFLPEVGATTERTLKTSQVQVDVTLTSWLTEGNTLHSFYNQNPLFGNPTSKLEFKDVGTTVTELGIKAAFPNRFFVRGQFGYGAVGGGRLIDDDFVSAAGATAFGTTVSGEHRFSRTHSDLNGSHTLYLNADVGRKLFVFAEERGSVSVFIGYQFRREQLEATGVTQVECTAPGMRCNPAGTVTNVGQLAITNVAIWHAARLGIEGDVQVVSRVRLDGKFAFLPITGLQNEDTHHLRTDLKQDPSISITGTGIGFNAEANASVNILERLFFEMGYRYWWNRVSDGDVVFHGVTGDSRDLPLNEFRLIRQGVTFGLRYAF